MNWEGRKEAQKEGEGKRGTEGRNRGREQREGTGRKREKEQVGGEGRNRGKEHAYCSFLCVSIADSLVFLYCLKLALVLSSCNRSKKYETNIIL